MNCPDQNPTDLRVLGRQFVELLDKLRSGKRLAVESSGSQAPRGDDLFLVIDHEGVLVCAVKTEREFEIARTVRTIEILAREIPATMQPEHQLALAGRRAAEIMPRFQMIRP